MSYTLHNDPLQVISESHPNPLPLCPPFKSETGRIQDASICIRVTVSQSPRNVKNAIFRTTALSVRDGSRLAAERESATCNDNEVDTSLGFDCCRGKKIYWKDVIWSQRNVSVLYWQKKAG